MKYWFSIVYIIVSMIYVSSGFYVYFRNKKDLTGKIFLALCFELFGWSFTYGMMNLIDDPEIVANVKKIGSISWNLFYPTLVHFFIVFSGLYDKMQENKNKLYLIYIIPIISFIVSFYKISAGDFSPSDMGWVYKDNLEQSFLMVNMITFISLIYTFSAIGIFVYTFLKTEKTRIKKSVGLLLPVIFLAFLSGFITDVIIPQIFYINIPQLAILFLTFPILCTVYAISKYSFLTWGSENTILNILENMNDAMMLITEDSKINYTNTVCSKLLQKTNLLFENVDIFSNRNKMNKEISVEVADGNLNYYNFTSFPIYDKWEDYTGSIYFFKNITDLKKAQLELQRSYDDLEVKVAERTKNLVELNESMKQEISRRLETELDLKIANSTDDLTGLLNRREFTLRAQRLFEFNSHNEYVLLYSDINAFKSINDTLGHAFGDKVIRTFAQRLTTLFFGYDNFSIISRIGGDEFLILVDMTDSEATLESIISDVLDTFKVTIIIDDINVKASASIGISRFPNDGDNINDLIKSADMALYESQQEGRGGYSFFTQNMQQKVEQEFYTSRDIAEGIDREEFEMFYQAQVHTSELGDRIRGFESLIRWNHPKRGLLTPFHFIDIAEKYNLINRLGDWILESVFKQAVQWNRDRDVPLIISVNLSAAQLLDLSLPDKVDALVQKTGVDPKTIEMEITETMLVSNVEMVINSLNKFKEMGFRISVDDFGTKYSSLNYIQQLPLDKLKIDMSFVRGIGKNEKEEAIIKALISLTNDIKVDIIAEGVETDYQLEYLKENGCNLIQGYYFYKPMRVVDIDDSDMLKAEHI